MFAVIASGGKQHKVIEGEILRLEKLNTPAGEMLEFDQVLMIGAEDDAKEVKIGTPYVDGSKVVAEVLSHGKGNKIDVVKFHRRKGYRRKQGHRQQYTEIQIKTISA